MTEDIDLFPVEQESEADLFPSETSVGTNPYTPKYTEDRAFYSALAVEGVSGDEAFEMIVSRNRDLIERGQEQLIENQAALERKGRTLEANVSIQKDLLFTPNSASLINLFEESRQATSAREERSAIEKEAIQRLQDLMIEDPYQASLFVNRVNSGDLIDRQLSHATKLAIFQREADKLQQMADEQGIAGKVLDFFSGAIDAPFASLGEVLNIQDEAVEGGERGLFQRPSSKVQSETANLFNSNISIDEFDERVTAAAEIIRRNSGVLRDNPSIAVQDFASLGGLNNSDALAYDFFTALDVATLPGVGLAAKSISNPVRFAKAVGNRAAAVRGAVGSITTPSTEAAANAAALREAIPNSLVPDLPGFVDPAIGLSGDVANRLDVIARVRAEAISIQSVERLEPSQFAEAVAKKVEERIGDFSDHNIVDVKQVAPDASIVADKAAVEVDELTGVRSFNLYLGRRKGEGGYITEKAAKAARTRAGFNEADAEIYHGIDDRYYLKVKTNVPETGITTPVLKIDELGNTGRIGAWFKNPDNSIARVFAEKQHITEGIQSRLHSAVVKPLLKPVGRLTKNEQKSLQTILALGEKEQVRFSQEELARHYENTFDRLPTPKEVEAYYNVQELQDFAWSVLDRNVFVDKVRRGFETVRVSDGAAFDTLRRNGRIAAAGKTRTNRVYDLEDQRAFAAGTNEAKFAEKMETGNYKLVELEGDYVFADEPVKYILAHKNSVQRGPLNRTQLGYVPGGQRIYPHKFFIKQANSFEFKDGTKAFRNPLTHFAVATEREAKELASKWETARLAFLDVEKGTISPADADIIISENLSLDYTKFEELVLKGKINKNHKFEALFDRTQPSEMTGVGENNLFIDEFDSGTTEYLTTRGRLYYSKKSDEGLENPDLERAEVLQPFKALEKSINFAINSRSISDYSTFAVEEWARLASPFIRRGQFSENPDKFRLFFDGQLDENFVKNNPKAAVTLEANRDTIKRFLGFQTGGMSRKEMAVRALANWIEDEARFAADPRKLIPKDARRFAARKTMDLLDKNPANAVNAAVFHSQFGFYDPGQLFLQSQTATAALTIHPLWGARAAAMYPMLRLVSANLNEGVLDYVAKRAAKVHDLPVDEFKTMVRTMIRAGEYDIGGSALQYGRFHQSVGGAGVIESAAKVVGKGRVFFDEAERINRSVAWQIAWKETRQKLPDLALDSEEFIRTVKLRASDFGQSMRNASAAQWQKGAFAPATRFMSYQARLLENILPKQFGGNPRFSAGQKFRLATGQFLLYGTAGLPILDYAAEQWKQNRGEDLTPEQWRAVTKGFYDNFLYGISNGDLDTDFSSRAGIGAGWSQTIERLIDGTNNSVVEVAGGPAYSIGGDVFDSFRRIMEYSKAGLTEEDIGPEVFKLIVGDLAGNINSLERYNKAAIIWRYGKLRDKVTGQPVVDATDLEGFAALLGIPLSEEKDLFEQYKAVANRQDEIDNNAKLLVKFNTEYFDAMAIKDERGMKAALQLKAALMRSFADDPLMQQQIANRAVSIDARVIDKATYAREQYEKILGQQVPTDERQ